MAQSQEGNSAGPGGDEEALVVATRVGSLQQADVIRAALAGEGIPAIVADEGASNVLSYMGPAIHPYLAHPGLRGPAAQRACLQGDTRYDSSASGWLSPARSQTGERHSWNTVSSAAAT